MGNSLYNYYRLYVRSDLIARFNMLELKSIAEISFIKVEVKLNDVASLEDMRILGSVEFIEKLTGQKCLVRDIGTIQGKRGYSKGRNVECLVTLRREKLYSFLKYLIVSVLPISIKRYGLPKLNLLGEGMYMLQFMDINAFYKLKLNNTTNERLNVYIKVNGWSKQHKILLRSLGLLFN